MLGNTLVIITSKILPIGNYILNRRIVNILDAINTTQYNIALAEIRFLEINFITIRNLNGRTKPISLLFSIYLYNNTALN